MVSEPASERVGDADRAAHEPSHSSVSRPFGEHPSRLTALAKRCRRLLNPQTGLCRGMLLNADKPHDRLTDVFPTTVGELLGVAEVLAECAEALTAIAMEARQGTDPKGLDGEAATARAEGIAHV